MFFKSSAFIFSSIHSYVLYSYHSSITYYDLLTPDVTLASLVPPPCGTSAPLVGPVGHVVQLWWRSETCYQVGHGPHGALQLGRGGRVPPHVLGVTFIDADHFVHVLFKVRHVLRNVRIPGNSAAVERSQVPLLFQTQNTNFRATRSAGHLCPPPAVVLKRIGSGSWCYHVTPSSSSSSSSSSGHVIVASASNPSCHVDRRRSRYRNTRFIAFTRETDAEAATGLTCFSRAVTPGANG